MLGAIFFGSSGETCFYIFVFPSHSVNYAILSGFPFTLRPHFSVVRYFNWVYRTYVIYEVTLSLKAVENDNRHKNRIEISVTT